MDSFELIATATFGLEAVVKREIEALGYRITDSRNGRLTYEGDLRAIVRSNLWLRCADRVYVKLGEFTARTFEELFQAAKALPWEEWLPENAHFSVTGSSARSILHSVPACQSIIEKAIVTRLGAHYGVERFKKNGPVYAVRFMAQKDEFVLMINTSGPGLHDRGYRVKDVPAPIKETMAAAMVMISRYRGKEDFCDPFCGSGTIPIEAALIARNIAPGLNRTFSAEKWGEANSSLWQEAREEARAREFHGDYHIVGSDIDPAAIRIAQENAQRAGVADLVRFEVADAMQFNRKTEAGIIVTNPPYGERIMEKQEAETLYHGFGKAWAASENWKLYLLSSHTEFERTFGRQADKKRKLYNGMIKCDLFMYFR